MLRLIGRLADGWVPNRRPASQLQTLAAEVAPALREALAAHRSGD
jgi:hypothetical protein